MEDECQNKIRTCHTWRWHLSLCWNIARAGGVDMSLNTGLDLYDSVGRRLPSQEDKRTIVESYVEKNSMLEISEATGWSLTTVWNIIHEKGISRSLEEAHKLAYEKGRRTPHSMFGKENPSYKGDEAGYWAQHDGAQRDFPEPLGNCQVCQINSATQRARIDHTNLPYRKEYVLPMCQSCNEKHDLYHARWGTLIKGGFVILFQEVP